MDGELRPAAQDARRADPLANGMHSGTRQGELVGAHFLGHVFWANKKGDSLQQGAKQKLKNTRSKNQERENILID